jgi:hypothetical protein
MAVKDLAQEISTTAMADLVADDLEEVTVEIRILAVSADLEAVLEENRILVPAIMSRVVDIGTGIDTAETRMSLES